MLLQNYDARAVTATLGGHWHGTYGAAPCPVCQPTRRRNRNALTLNDGSNGRLLAHCKKSGCSFRDILAAAGIAPGNYRAPDAAELARRESERLEREARISERAEAAWHGAFPIHGTPAETYLRGRGITCDLPDTLRYHPACFHGPTRTTQPAMIAGVSGGGVAAIHRTFIRADGLGKAGLRGGDKMMLGRTAWRAVRLSRGGSRLVVCEGIETGLSLLSGLLDGPATVLAACSASGMRSLRLPTAPGDLVIAPDGDRIGRGAAYTLARTASGMGWRVSMMSPPDGLDFNDVLCGWAEV